MASRSVSRSVHEHARGPAYELAQVNIARLKSPLDSPQLADFVAALDPVNAVADAADGFVWRLQGDDGNATSIPVLGDRWLIVNMSVWRDVDALSAFMYDTPHREVLRRRREWFERIEEAVTALWWVAAGHRPAVSEAEQRLLHLRAHGPTPEAFSLREPFPAPDGTPAGAPAAGCAAG
ncbi:DUF3291 domain-containing protein [Streptomyces sp. RB6PN25]|uniref:DUF3291 domain-containing protein n=1 Tax=Streptomyces humicola TaxID=2953240 RepID=A0ABT1PQY2_9ACTN|nr:DUF3291 domain-containing protein [Streptomyces humicola]MCQ4080086.1 DUF3291 domain-containing protein [Streptomyces humicola]